MAPVNDSFANRILLTGDTFNIAGDTTDASFETEELAVYTSIYGGGDGSVWYEWVAPSDGILSLTMKSPSLDGILWVLTGTAINNLVVVGYNDDENIPPYSYLNSYLTLPVKAGVSYKISVTGYSDGDFGPFVLDGVLLPFAVNDNFANALPITLRSFPLTGIDNTTATQEAGEPSGQYSSLWHSFTPESDGLIHFTVNGNNTIAKLGVYLGNTIGTLQKIGAGNNFSIPIYAGSAYKFAIYSQTNNFDGTSVSAGMSVTISFTAIPRPLNDNFTQAIELTGSSFSASADNSMATMELFEDPTNYFSVWYDLNPTEDGVLTLTAVSGIALNFKVYQGDSIVNAKQVGAANDTLTLTILGGVTYKIAVCSQDLSTFGAFSFSGAFADEIPFKYTTVNSGISNTGAGNPNENRSADQRIVQESGGRIWAASVSNPNAGNVSTASYSDDSGLTWTVDANSIIDNPLGNRGYECIFLDENENLVLFKYFDTGGNTSHVKAYVRNKGSGIWTTYDSTLNAVASFFNWGTYGISVTQDDTGRIHIIRVIETDLGSSLNFFNIFYHNYLDGVNSAVQQLTFYSGSYDASYLDSIAYANGSNYTFALIVWHNSQLLILWSLASTTLFSGGPHFWNDVLFSMKYSVLGDNIDCLQSSHPWITSAQYYIGYMVTHGGLYYRCAVNHVSGIFATDLGNGKWAAVASNTFTAPTVLNSFQGVGPTSGGSPLGEFAIPSIRSTGSHLYYLLSSHIANPSDIHTLQLFKDFTDITPVSPSWIDFVDPQFNFSPMFLEAAQNDDLMLHGVDNRVGHATAVARINGAWRAEHTDNRNVMSGSHTYNFAKIR